MRLVALFVGWCVIPSSRGAHYLVNAPNSFERTTTAAVRIRHVHRSTDACVPDATRADARCQPVYSFRDPTTALTLEPLPARRIRGSREARKPVDVIVGSEGVPNGGDVGVAPGAWRIVWPGHPSQRTFRAGAGDLVHVRLNTTFGHCERVELQCELRPGVWKTVDVAVP
jgi:hypothetical protein